MTSQLSEWLASKRTQTTSAGKDVETRELHHWWQWELVAVGSGGGGNWWRCELVRQFLKKLE